MLQCQWVSPSEDSSPPRLKCREAEQKSALFSTGSQNLKICLRADSKLFLSCKIRKLTCCSNTIKPNKSIETGCSTRQDSREAERHETTNTQTLWLQLGCTENTKQDQVIASPSHKDDKVLKMYLNYCKTTFFKIICKQTRSTFFL